MQQHTAVNYTGALHVTRCRAAALRHPPLLGSHLSLVSSVAGFRGLGQGLAYGPKGGATHLAETPVPGPARPGPGSERGAPRLCGHALTASNHFRMPA